MKTTQKPNTITREKERKFIPTKSVNSTCFIILVDKEHVVTRSLIMQGNSTTEQEIMLIDLNRVERKETLITWYLK